MIRRRVLITALAALGTTACLDFTAPELPALVTPAVGNFAVRAFDSGSLQVDGSLQPGRDSAGFQRVVQSAFVQANNFLVQPQSLGAGGLRVYNTTFTTPPNQTGGPFHITLPDVRDVGTMPVVQWNGLVRRDADTVYAVRGQDIVLRLDTIAQPSTPAPFRQWFLDIRAGIRVFRLSSDGLPPLTLRIPADFVPPSTETRAFVSLIYFQTGQVRTPTNEYFSGVTLDVRVNWVVVFRNAP